MLLQVSRDPSTDAFTDGLFRIDGRFFGYTVEDIVRAMGEKVPGKTAIPAGRYEVTVEVSPHFSERAGIKVELPRLHDVPGFDGVLIHGGNTADDSEGCILVASNFLEPGRIQGSLSNALTVKLKQANGPHFIDIFNASR